MRSPSPQSNHRANGAQPQTQDNISEIVSLLCGLPPTPENKTQVLQRTYCFGDSLQPVVVGANTTSCDSGVDTMTYFLGLPPTDEMNDVTRVMLQRRSSQQDLQYHPTSCPVALPSSSHIAAHDTPSPSSPLVADTFPPFSSADYDVVSYVAKQFYQAAQRCGTTLHRATHHRGAGSPATTSAAHGQRSSQRHAVSAPSEAALSEPDALVMPEELLGA